MVDRTPQRQLARQPQRPLTRRLLQAAQATAAATLALAASAQQFVARTQDGAVAGGLVIETSADGETVARYRWRNNGRGPDTVEHYRLDAGGLPLRYSVSGTTTMGSVIDEQFERQGGTVRWRSQVDQGEMPGPAGAAGVLYAAMNGSPAVDVIAAEALARLPDHSLPLTPSGRLRQTVLDRITVSAAGQRQALQLVAHTGLGLEPNYLWLTDEAQPRFFAAVAPGYFSLAPDAWQPVLAELGQRQKEAAATLEQQRAADWLKPLPGLTLVRNARVFDSLAAKLGPASDVYLLRGRITAVLPTGTFAAQAPDTTIDAAGRVMLPGLFDMHDHAWRLAGGLHLAAGVTSTRDLGNDNAELQRLIDDVASLRLAYPQVIPAGFIEGESPFASRQAFVIKTLAEAKAAVDWYAQRGYPQIKIYNSFPKEHLRETVAYAHALGLRVSGHVPAFLRADDVLDAGFDEIQHVNQMLLNFLVTPSTDTRTLERFTLPAERLGELDLDSAPVRTFIERLARQGTVADLTLMAFQFIQQRDRERPAEMLGAFEHLPPDLQRGALTASMKIPDEATARRNRAAVAQFDAFATRLFKAGVPMVAGTDGLPGLTLHSELIRYVKIGMSPAQALQVATVNGARYTGTLADRGSITPGKRADLLLVDGEPTERIEDLRRVALVITQGHWLAPREVHEAIGVAPFVAATPTVEARRP